VVLQLGGWATCLQLLALKIDLVTKCIPVFWARTDPLVKPNPWKNDMRSNVWKVRVLYRSGSLTTVARELAKYKLYLEGVWEVRGGQRGNGRSRVL